MSSSVATSTPSYIDTGLSPGTTYTYRIQAANSAGTAAWSNTATATTQGDAAPPPPVTPPPSSGGGGGGGAAPTSPAEANAIALGPTALSFTVRQGGRQPAAQDLCRVEHQVRSHGLQRLRQRPLAHATPSQGSSSGPNDRARVSVFVNPVGLQAGTYTGFVRIVAYTAGNWPQHVTVTLTVLPPETAWGGASPGQSAQIETPDGSAQVEAPAGAAPAGSRSG